MDNIKKWIIVILFSALISTIIELMLPNSKTEKTVKTVISLFLICVCITPITSTLCKIPTCLETNKNTQIDKKLATKIKKQEKKSICENIKQIAAKTLEEKNISYTKLEVNIQDENINDIKSIEIKVHTKDSTAKDILKKALGLEVKITEPKNERTDENEKK